MLLLQAGNSLTDILRLGLSVGGCEMNWAAASLAISLIYQISL